MEPFNSKGILPKHIGFFTKLNTFPFFKGRCPRRCGDKGVLINYNYDLYFSW